MANRKLRDKLVYAIEHNRDFDSSLYTAEEICEATRRAESRIARKTTPEPQLTPAQIKWRARKLAIDKYKLKKKIEQAGHEDYYLK